MFFVNNTTTAANSKVLLPVTVGVVADCHPAGVRFIRLQQELDFATLPPGAVCSLVTFQGAADLHTLSINKIYTDILKEGSYYGTIDLSSARDFSTEATIDNEIFYESIIKKIFCMGFEPILKDLFD